MKHLVSLLIVIFLVGCAEPLPDSQKKFVGLWKSNQTTLLITESGRLEYKTQKGAVNTSISMPIKSISNSKIVAGFLFIKSEFSLKGEPSDDAGVLMLMVDGEKLFKMNPLGRFPQATKIPPIEELRLLVSNDLNLLAEAVNKNDFSDYLKSAALLYQNQFSNERLIDVYKEFTARKVDLTQWMTSDIILTQEPRIDETGVLRVEGKYSKSPTFLNFSASYVYSHPSWKSMGANVQLNDK